MDRRSISATVIVLLVVTSGLTAAAVGVGPVLDVEDPGDLLPLDTLPLAPSSSGPQRPVFMMNDGQFGDDEVVLYGDLPHGGIAFKAGGVLMNQESTGVDDAHRASPDPSYPGRGNLGKHLKLLETPVTGSTVELTFIGGEEVVPRGGLPVPGNYNFMLGDAKEGWVTGVRAFSEVLFEDLYPGIDLVYRVTDAGLKYEFLVGPGADPSSISVRVAGHTSLTTDGGTIVIGTGLADIVDSGLDVFYADGDGERLRARFDLRGPDNYGFAIEDRDPSRAIVVDPLVFSTYLGSDQWDSINGMLVDEGGYVYVVGESNGDDFPTTPGVYQKDLKNFQDIFVTKLEPDGGSLVWSTFIGGTDMDMASDVVLDGSGNIYVCGGTFSDNYPTTTDAYQNRTMGHGDALVSKLSPDGARLLASTILGGFWEDYAESIDVDGSGNIYIVGTTRSIDFPTTPGALDRTMNGQDAFVTKINRQATDLTYSTFLGGSGQDAGDSIVLDGNGSVYVGGNAWSTDFPVTSGAFRERAAGSGDAFVTQLAPDGGSLNASTYLGGQFYDRALGLALGSDGDVHVFGTTQSDDFPVTKDAFQTTHGSTTEDDAFATRLNWNLTTVKTSTFIDGDSEDSCEDGTLDSEDNVVIGGSTLSTDYPTTAGSYQPSKSAFSDMFVTKLSANYSSLLYSTHIGSIESDRGLAVAAFGKLNVYVAGETHSDKFPTTTGAYQTESAGNRDAAVAMFSLDLYPPVAEAGEDVTVDQHESVQFDGSASGDNEGVINWTWSFKYDGSKVELYGVDPSWTFDRAGLYQVELKVRDGARHEGTDLVNVTVIDITPPVAEAGLSKTIRQGETATFDGSGSTDNVGVVNWTWSFDHLGQPVVLHGQLAEFTFDIAGTFNVSLTVLDAVGLNATDHLTVDVLDLDAPIANAGEDIVADQGELVELNGSLSSDTTGIVNWTWSFVHAGSPVEVYGEVAVFTFEIVGVYEVLLRVEDDAGNQDVDTVTVTVRDSTPPVADPGPDRTVDEDIAITFDGTGSTDNVGIVSYEWSFDLEGQTITLDGAGPSYTFTTPGEYTVTLEVLDGEGNLGEATLIVTVLDQTSPEADAGAYDTVAQGDTVTLDGSSSTDNGVIVSYTWTFEHGGGTVTLDGKTASFVFEEAGEFIVTLTVTDAGGNTDQDEATVTVRDVTPPLVPEIDDRTIDQGSVLSVQMTGATDNVGVTSYAWSFVYEGNPLERAGDTLSHTFHVPGVYEITLTVGDAEGNSASETFTVTVRDTEQPIVHVDGTRHNVGVDERVRVDASGSTDNVGIVRWTWSYEEDGRTVTQDGPVFSHSFDEPGEYVITLTLEDAEGNTSTGTVTVTVEGSLLAWALLAIVLIVIAAAVVVLLRRRDTPNE